MTDTLWRQDAYSLAEDLTSGVCTPLQILDHFLNRIGALNPQLNAVVQFNDEAHMDAQASADRHSAGTPLSRLDGLPILLKDNLVVRGMPATWGSRLYADKVCTHDEIPVEKLRQAGAVIVGKTNVPEFTVEGYTDNKLFGLTPNPWDLSLTPGGSSGGSVAAVAAGMIPLSVGTDGGGSVRRPAAYAGLVGLKPTLGRIPRGGGLPQLLLDMEVIGPITRTVRDQAMVFDILAQPDIRDHRSLPFRAGRSLETLYDTPRALKILAVETFGDAPLDPVIRSSFREMTRSLTAIGHQVVSGELPLDIEDIVDNWTSIGDIGLGLLLQRKPEMRELASAKYVEWASKTYEATHLLNVLEMITKLRNEAVGVFRSIDLIMTPSCAAMPWSTDIPFPPEIDGQPVSPRGSAVYTGWVNACGHPAISVPGSTCGQPLPIGIQFVASSGDDELLLRLAQQIEIEQGWPDMWPEIAQTDE